MNTILLITLSLTEFYIYFKLDKSEKSVRHVFLIGGIIFAVSSILNYFKLM